VADVLTRSAWRDVSGRVYDDLLPSVQGQLLPLRNHECEIKKKALDSLNEQKLLEKAD